MANEVRSYKDLVAWQKSMNLVTAVYRASQRFPKEEIFGLVSQTGAPRYPFPAILPKVMPELQRRNSNIFSAMPAAPWRNEKPS
jgi:hypothetical protein